MRWFNNLKVSVKILSGFFLVALVAAAIGILGIVIINNMTTLDKEMYEQNTVAITMISDASTLFLNQRINMKEIALTRDIGKINSYKQKIDNLYEEIKRKNADIEKLMGESEKEKFNQYRTALENYQAILKKLTDLFLANKVEEGISVMADEGVKKAQALDADIAALIKEKKDAAKQKSDSNIKTSKTATIMMIVILIIGIVLSVIFGLIISKSITNPLKKVVKMFEELNLGHLKMRLRLDTKDEIGKMAVAMDNFAENLQHVIVGSMKKISNGDLSVEITQRDNEDEILPALINMVTALRGLVKETVTLSNSAIEGNLSTRGDTSKFEGAYKDIIKGINDTLDAVIQPIKESSSVLQEMAKGNLKTTVNGNYKGDHAEIKDALNFTLKTVSGYINEISKVLTEMSKGNLVVSIDREYLGDFSEIKYSLNNIIDSFNDMMSNINQSAEQVAAGSKQVSQSSQALSQGSTEQAASIEEITSSMTEIAAQTRQNATNANQANEIAMSSKENATSGNSQMQDMLKSMGEINDASSNISKIIKVIDEIAFQTNILALNAAVEAARAGQHGKGFAVVAEEVRNLAARSANAAKETTSLIEGSIEKVQAGTKIANETANALNKIVDGVTRFAEIVGGIAIASNEQANGIAQVNTAIEQVSQVTQTNSATAQECAAASEELSSQAELLKDTVARFKIKNGKTIHSENNTRKNLYNDIDNFQASTLNNKITKINLSESEFGKY